MIDVTPQIVAAAADGVQIHIWPTAGGLFQANISERGSAGWTCVTDEDPVWALSEALRQRASGHRGRVVVPAPEQQIDIEDAIAEASVDEFEGLL